MAQPTSALQITNFDDAVPKGKRERPSVHPHMFQYQFGAILSGPTGCGKSNMLLNCLTRYLHYDRVYLFMKEDTEDKVEFLRQFFKGVKKERKKMIEDYSSDSDDTSYSNSEDDPKKPLDFDYMISNDWREIPALEDLDSKYQHVFVFDDLVNTQDKELKQIISEYAIRSRKRNVSWFYLSQKYFDIPKMLRENAKYVALWKVDKRTVSEFYKSFGTAINKEQFYACYDKATREPYSFFLIDLKTNDGKMRFRRMFEPDLWDCDRGVQLWPRREAIKMVREWVPETKGVTPRRKIKPPNPYD